MKGTLPRGFTSSSSWFQSAVFLRLLGLAQHLTAHQVQSGSDLRSSLPTFWTPSATTCSPASAPRQSPRGRQCAQLTFSPTDTTLFSAFTMHLIAALEFHDRSLGHRGAFLILIGHGIFAIARAEEYCRILRRAGTLIVPVFTSTWRSVRWNSPDRDKHSSERSSQRIVFETIPAFSVAMRYSCSPTEI